MKPAELNELIRRAQEGDIEARNAAVMANSRLVARLAFAACGGDRRLLDDYIQAGIAGHGAGNGLINAVMTYRLEGQPHVLGTWPAYAKRGVLSALNAFAPDAGREVSTRRRREKMHRIRQVAKQLSCYEPDLLVLELKARGVPCSETDVWCALHPAKSSSYVEHEASSPEHDGSQKAQESAPDRKAMLEALEALPEHQRAAVRKRWGFGRAGGRLTCGEAEAADQGEAAIRQALGLDLE